VKGGIGGLRLEKEKFGKGKEVLLLIRGGGTSNLKRNVPSKLSSRYGTAFSFPICVFLDKTRGRKIEK